MRWPIKKNKIKKVISIGVFAPFLLFANNTYPVSTTTSANVQQYTQNLKAIQQVSLKGNNYKSMIFYYSHSADPKNWFALGAIYLNGLSKPDKNGETIKPDIKKAEYWLIKSMKNKFYTSGIFLASYFLYNPKYNTKKENLDKAKKILEYLISQKYYPAITYLADYYKITKNYDRFISTLIMGDQYRNATAQLSLALMYYYGIKNNNKVILPRDYNVANYYLTKACTNPKKNKTVANFCNPNNNKNIVYDKIKK